MDKKKIDLGCGTKKRDGAIGVDLAAGEKIDIVCDLDKFPWPFRDNYFEDILIDNCLEHLSEQVRVMKEIWRIAKSGAVVRIFLPYFRHHTSVHPTHRFYFASHSFDNYDPDSHWNRLYKLSEATFKVEKVEFDKRCKYGKKRLIRWIIKKTANLSPSRYEYYLGHLFPLSELSFELRVIK